MSDLNTLTRLAIEFKNRSEAQDFKGKDRDKRAIEFFAGASSALQLVGHAEAQHVLNVTALIICTRGYSEVERIANAALPPKKEVA